MKAIGTAKTTLTAGLLVRKKVRRELDGFCFMNGIKATITEDKGWIDSKFYITLEGEEGPIRQVIAWLDSISKDN